MGRMPSRSKRCVETTAGLDTARLVGADEIDRRDRGGRDRLEGARAFLQRAQVLECDAPPVLAPGGCGGHDADEPGAVGERQRADQVAVEEAETHRVGRHADGQRERRGHREQRTPTERAERQPQIAREDVEPRQAALVARDLRDLNGPAETKACLPAGLLRGQAGALEILGEHVSVSGQFLREGRGVAIAADERAELRQEQSYGGHRSSASRNLDMMRLVARQLSVSACNCRRPARVRL